MRDLARRMFDAAVQAADPALALRPHLAGITATHIIAVGKAAVAMAEEAHKHLPDATGIIVTNAENARDIPGFTTYTAGHPVPDEGGLRAGQAVVDLLANAGPSDTILALISGGGSALLPAPVEGVSLQDKAEVSRQLLSAGFNITDMNLIRQHLSRLKGGGFLRIAAPAQVRAFILSDVIGDDLRVVASGPTVAPIGTRSMARELLQSRNIWEAMPGSVRRALSEPDHTTSLPHADNTLIGSNRQSLVAAQAVAPGSAIVNDNLVGDVAHAADFIIASAIHRPENILIFGGETTVNVIGTGKGGRNQELALRVALQAENAITGGWVFLSAGTDGRDGPTDAAGGIVDRFTLANIRTAADPLMLLQNNDAYHALFPNDLIFTGGTGTNVADIQIFLKA